MTLDPIQYAYAPVRPALENDRRGWLVAFGAVNLAIGAGLGCAVGGMIFGIAMLMGWGNIVPPGTAPPPPVSIGEVIAGITVFLALTAWFVWTGIDSIRCKRWVARVTIAMALFSIAMTLFYLAFYLVAFPALRTELGDTPTTTATTLPATTAASPPPPTTRPTTAPTTANTVTISVTPTGVVSGTGTLPAVVALATTFLLGMLLPGVYAWFYSRPTVRQTLAVYDPRRSWTDRCPIPLLIVSAGLVVGSTGLLTPAAHAALPLFGVFMTGAPAVVVSLATAAVLVLAAVLIARVNRVGWWLALAIVSAGYLSFGTTLWALGPVEFYAQAAAGSIEVEHVRRSAALHGRAPLAFTILSGAACLAYLLWVARYFRARADAPA